MPQRPPPPATPKRKAGVLLHPTSLPGPLGHGDLGPQAHAFAEWAARGGLGLWQTLPLVPPGPGQSPYSSWSAFCGSPYLVSPEVLYQWGLLDKEESTLWTHWGPPSHKATPHLGQPLRKKLLNTASQVFLSKGPQTLTQNYQEFCHNAPWLEDAALFWVLWQHHGKPWWLWPLEQKSRNPQALKTITCSKSEDIEIFKTQQFFFHQQLQDLKKTCEKLGVELVGDIPIYVDHCSADVWAHQEGFQLDAEGMPVVVSGVPPDAYCPEGQRWGTPIYHWDVMMPWWQKRFQRALEMAHWVRLDHFRGLASYWEVPAQDPTAAGGQWVKGPGAPLLKALKEVAPQPLPLIAEDLGYMTPDVHALRDGEGLAGMKILQFAFDGSAANEHLPHNTTANYWVYTGTHDNNTTLGWLKSLSPLHQAQVALYLGNEGPAPLKKCCRGLVGLALASVAQVAIIPMQDLMGLDAKHRMNTPGTLDGNWLWRLKALPSDDLAKWLRSLVNAYGRGPH